MAQKWHKKASVQTAIITGFFLIVAAVIAGIFEMYEGFFSIKKLPETVSADSITSVINPISPDSTTDDAIEKGDLSFLTDDQLRMQISKSLQLGKTERAIQYLKAISSSEVKDEENERVFTFCLKKGELDNANIIAELFENPDKKIQAKSRVEHERLKGQTM